MPSKPSKIRIGDKVWLTERQSLDQEAYTWQALEKGGILSIRHDSGQFVTIYR
jgi:hypothetical protein